MVVYSECLARDVLIFNLAFTSFDKTIDNRKAYFMNDRSLSIFFHVISAEYIAWGLRLLFN